VIFRFALIVQTYMRMGIKEQKICYCLYVYKSQSNILVKLLYIHGTLLAFNAHDKFFCLDLTYSRVNGNFRVSMP